MKNKKNYALLERRIYTKFCLILVSIAIALYTLAELLRGYFGDTFVSILEDIFDLSNEEALFIYQRIIQDNVYTIMIILLIIIIIVMFRMFISSITRYFDEIAHAADALTQTNQQIYLSPELSFMEIKLQRCKDMMLRREEEAKQAEQRKNDLVVYLAHDIKTPLTSVIGYLELLNESPDMPMEQRAKYTNITLNKANRLEQLINEFFDITRFNLDSIILHKQQVNIVFMLQQLADEFYPMAQEKKITITLTVPEEATIYADSDKLSRVFNNIIKNAISYSYEDSEITITLTVERRNSTVTITNIGDTIVKEELKAIFEKFYRLDSARSTTSGGSGLGLSIAKEIVLAHKGQIHAKSENHITSFIVTIPNEYNE